MCERKKWKKNVLGIGLAALCFLAVPVSAYATENVGTDAPGEQQGRTVSSGIIAGAQESGSQS